MCVRCVCVCTYVCVCMCVSGCVCTAAWCHGVGGGRDGDGHCVCEHGHCVASKEFSNGATLYVGGSLAFEAACAHGRLQVRHLISQQQPFSGCLRGPRASHNTQHPTQAMHSPKRFAAKGTAPGPQTSNPCRTRDSPSHEPKNPTHKRKYRTHKPRSSTHKRNSAIHIPRGQFTN
jgi:hypothetical protein